MVACLTLLRVANSRSKGTSAYHPPFWILIFRRGCVALDSNLWRSVVANRAFCDDYTLVQRYSAEFYPFDFCFVLFLSVGGTSLIRTRYLLMSLVLISAVINSLA